jgi:hypothetical protein
VSLPAENFDGLVVAARKISASTPHCYSQRLVPFSKSGVPGQKLMKDEQGRDVHRQLQDKLAKS